MSWSFSSQETFERKDILHDVQPKRQEQPVGAQEPSADQINAAKAAAVLLAIAIGRPADRVKISMSGHANPDHAPMVGWADEYVTVSVSAVPTKLP